MILHAKVNISYFYVFNLKFSKLFVEIIVYRKCHTYLELKQMLLRIIS